jgi:RNA polymerase sigma-70 factor, ECF subfamily
MVLSQGTARAPFGRHAIVNGAPGVVVVRSGRVLAVAAFTTTSNRITSLDLIADPKKLRHVRV